LGELDIFNELALIHEKEIGSSENINLDLVADPRIKNTRKIGTIIEGGREMDFPFFCLEGILNGIGFHILR
jgi:hypothetical protein